MFVVDYREKELLAALGSVSSAALPLGDIRVGHLLIERKTGADLARSIVDGRWRDQKARLLEQNEFEPVILVEGPLTGLPRKVLQGALCNTFLRDRIHVIRTSDMADTVLVLRLLASKVERPLAMRSLRAPRTKRKREEDYTYQRMLMCVPGVSEAVADVLARAYASLTDLQKELRTNQDAVACLQRTPKRRVGPAIVRALCKHLLDAAPSSGGS